MIRRSTRIGVSLVLLLSLLGLSTSDAAVCWGTDGHVGLETRFNSCCHEEMPGGSPAASTGFSELAGADRACGDGGCEDLPVMQGTPAARPDQAPPASLTAATIVPPPLAAPILRVSAHPPVAATHLERLRTTTLLI